MLIWHSILYVIAKFLPGLLGVATTLILTHFFDPAQYGTYALIIVIMTLTGNIGFDWLGVSFLRFYESARRPAPHTLATFVRIFAILLALSALIGFSLSFIGSSQGFSAPVCALGILLAWSYSCFEMISRFEVVNFRPIRYLIMNLARGISTLSGAVAAAWLTADPMWTAAGMGAGMLLGVIPTTARISLTELKHFNRDLALQIFRFGVPLAISMTLTGLISSVTRLLVETLDSREALGLYTVAFVLVQNSLTVLAAGISSTGYQLTVRAVEGGDVAGERRQLLNNGALLLSVLAPACVGMILTAQDIGANLVGAEFRDAVTTLTPWLAAASFFACLRAFFFDYSFQLGNRPNAQAWVTAIAAGIAIGLSVYLIPRDGPLGAAIAVAVSMFVSCCLAAVVGRRVYYLPFPVQSAFRVLLCCFVMGAFVFIMPGTGKMAFMCKVAVGVFVYTCAGVALNLLDLRIQLTAYIKGAARQGS